MKFIIKLLLIFFFVSVNVAFANTIKLVVTSGAGGITHRYALNVLPVISEATKKDVILEIRSGAEGYIAAKYVNQYRNTDNLFLMIGSPKDWKNINADLSQIDDFITVSYLGYMPHLLLSSDNLSIRDLLTKGKTSNISYAISINNPARPLIKELIREYSNEKNIVEVTFKSGSEVIAAMLGNHVNFGVVVPEIARIAIDNSKLNVIATIGDFSKYEDYNLEKQGYKLTDTEKYLNHVFLWSNITNNSDIKLIHEKMKQYLVSDLFENIRKEYSLVINKEYMKYPHKALKTILDR